ncbi:MAG: type 4a pilus biogenesis protein PilO [Actinomycetota bacterium]|nr:type 4a pilus biogenesis protein PilO [Actinomycetota bacterium]MDD5666048.1 type 4a pilus biogenesis protein PilO [Actinomycetota bacterium]
MKIRASSGLWLLVGALVCIIILVLGLFLVVFPQRNKVGEVEDEIKKTESSIQSEQNRLNQLRQLEKDPEQFQRQLNVLLERIPQDVELADIIQQIDYAAEEAGLDFFSITPKVPVSAGSYYTVTCETVFHGRYFNLVEFFNRIERLPRSVKVVFLDIAASDGGLPYLQIRVDFRAFFTTNQGIEGLVQSTAG